MSYATCQEVCNALNLESIDSVRASIIERLISTAESMIDDITHTSFDLEVRQEELIGECSNELFPRGSNISQIVWAGFDPYHFISITCASCEQFIWEKKGTTFAVTVDGTRYETTFEYTDTVQDIVDWLNNSTSGVVADLEDDDLASYTAWSIYDQFKTWAEGSSTTGIFYVVGATQRLTCSFTSEGRLRCDRVIGDGDIVRLVYQSGYSTIPAAIKEATILAASMLYRMLNQDGTLQSERIGDYSYNLKSFDDISKSIVGMIKPILKPYIHLHV